MSYNVILDIKPIHEEYRSCTEDIICTVCGWLDIDHQMMYSESWDFLYEVWRPGLPYSIGARLSEGEDRAWDNIKRYHGLKMEYNSNLLSFSKAGKTILNQLLTGYPVMVFLDGYWCSWRREDREKHMYTTILIVGYLEKGDLYYCIDPFYTEEVLEVPAETLNLAYKNCLTFVKERYMKATGEQSLYSSPGRLLSSADGNGFDRMYKFAHDMESRLDFHLEASETDDEKMKIRLFNVVKYLLRRRKQYAVFLDYYGAIYGKELHESVEKMESISNMWGEILKLLMRTYYTGDWLKKRKHIVEKIYDVIKIEKQTAITIMRIK